MTELLIVIAADVEWDVSCRHLGVEGGAALAPGETARSASVPGAVVLRSGWGKVAAASATQRAIDDHRPRMILCVGTCGGIPGRAEPGELVVAERTVMHDVRPLMGDIEGERAHYSSDADVGLVARTVRACGLRAVTIGTGDRDLYEAEAAELARSGVDVVDWEAAAIAFVARTNNVRWLIIKGVSDAVSSAVGAADLHAAYARGAEHVMKRLIELIDRVAVLHSRA